MMKVYKTDIETGKFRKTNIIEKGVWINLVNPTDKEIEKVCTSINLE